MSDNQFTLPVSTQPHPGKAMSERVGHFLLSNAFLKPTAESWMILKRDLEVFAVSIKEARDRADVLGNHRTLANLVLLRQRLYCYAFFPCTDKDHDVRLAFKETCHVKVWRRFMSRESANSGSEIMLDMTDLLDEPTIQLVVKKGGELKIGVNPQYRFNEGYREVKSKL